MSLINKNNIILRWHCNTDVDVKIAGNFNNWTLIPMVKNNNIWEYPVPIESKNYLYKFYVNGEWICNNTEKIITDLDGNENNIIVITNLLLYLNELANDEIKELLKSDIKSNEDKHIELYIETMKKNKADFNENNIKNIKDSIKNETKLLVEAIDKIKKEEIQIKDFENRLLEQKRLFHYREEKIKDYTDKIREKTDLITKLQEEIKTLNENRVLTKNQINAEKVMMIYKIRIINEYKSRKDHFKSGQVVENCSISLEPIKFYNSKITQCGHLFNKESLNQWLVNSTSCPLCRREI